MKRIDPNALICRSPNVVETKVDGQIVMMNVNEGKYYGPNMVGSQIWQLVQEPRTFLAICDALSELFNVESIPDYREQAREFIDVLVDKKLVEITQPS